MDEKRIGELLEIAKNFNRIHAKNPLTDVNLFSILKMENKEVSAHSAVLYYVFKPFVVDGKRDDLNLRILLKHLGYEENKYAYVDIQREVVTDFGRLDFLIEMDSDLLVIELKIWAHEQYAQISRYQQYLDTQRANGKVLFLTPTKREAKTGTQPVKNITLGEEIRSALEEVALFRKKRTENFEYCAVLKQYVNVIDKLTGGEMMSYAELLRTADDILAIDSLIKSRSEVLQRLMCEFFEVLKTGLISLTDGVRYMAIESCPKALLVEDDCAEQAKIYYEQEKSSAPSIIFELSDCELKNCEIDWTKYRLYFYVEIGVNLYAGLSLRKAEPKFGDLTKEEVADFKEVNPLVTSTFWAWDYVRLNGKVDFRNINSSNSWINKLFIKNSLEFDKNKMGQIIESVKMIYKNLCEKFLR